MATYAIGDIQGCFAELQELLQVVNFKPQEDWLWFVGDLVNRGPESLQVLRFVKKLPNKVVVLGNHDYHLLALYHNKEPLKITHTLHDTLNAPDIEELIDWLRCQPLIHYDKNLNYVLTHAGIYPGWDLTAALKYAREVEQIMCSDSYVELLAHMYGNQPVKWSEELIGFERYRFIINAFVRMRLCNSDLELEFETTGKPESASPGYLPWYEIVERKTTGERIIFGHWAALEGRVRVPNLFALDTGCVWGRELTALRLEDQQFFSVKSSSKFEECYQ